MGGLRLGTPTPRELALQAEVQELRERLARLEQEGQPEAGLVGDGAALRDTEARFRAW